MNEQQLDVNLVIKSLTTRITELVTQLAIAESKLETVSSELASLNEKNAAAPAPKK